MNNVAETVGLIGKGKGAKFASITYRKSDGELARYFLILGADTHILYEKDIVALESILPTLTGINKIAAEEILASRRKSLDVGIGNNPDYTCKDVYVHVDGVKGVKIHKDTGILYVNGLCEDKVVIEPATEDKKPVKSSEKTKAKRHLQYEHCPSVRFRQFIIKQVKRIAANGETLEIEGE